MVVEWPLTPGTHRSSELKARDTLDWIPTALRPRTRSVVAGARDLRVLLVTDRELLRVHVVAHVLVAVRSRIRVLAMQDLAAVGQHALHRLHAGAALRRLAAPHSRTMRRGSNALIYDAKGVAGVGGWSKAFPLY